MSDKIELLLGKVIEATKNQAGDIQEIKKNLSNHLQHHVDMVDKRSDRNFKIALSCVGFLLLGLQIFIVLVK